MRLDLPCTCRGLWRARSASAPPSTASLPRRIHLAQSPPVASTSALPPWQTQKGKAAERWPGWKPTIGLELHVQLKGNVKLLSPALAMYEATPNSHVAPFDAVLPGSLPILGKEPVRLALLACLSLKGDINKASTFDRKHYFYPDLPAGFQVTQKYSPLATGGSVRVRKDEEHHVLKAFDVRIDQIQLEQDTAKSFHDPESGNTLVDLNRAGAALIEIVTQPDMSSPEEAAAFVRHLQSILRHIGASDANMDRGELRCDVNVSVSRSSEGTPLGTRCEVKNLNGVRFLMAAIESEIRRQIIELEAGRDVVQATRGFDALTSETFHLRSKEDAPDYRYMPDPELGAVIISDACLESVRASLPELPDAAFNRLQSQYDLTPRDAGILVSLGGGMADDPYGGVKYFEDVAKGRDARVAVNWVLHELLGLLTKANLGLADSPVQAAQLGLIVDAVSDGRITGTSGKQILRDFIGHPEGSSIEELIAAQLSSTPSADEIVALCDRVILDLPKEAEKVRGGQQKVLMRLVGEVMKRSGGKADAKKVAARLRDLLA